MKKWLLLVGLACLQFWALAQYKVTILVNELPAYHRQGDAIYLAGSFNNWKAGDEQYQLKNINGKPGITIDLAKGMFEYKLTRGNWDLVESGEDGKMLPNHQLQVSGNDTVNVHVQHWADHFPKKPKRSTASKNVQVLDTSFYIPQLKRHRRIWIYLPEGYANSSEQYPVLYMQDGQNLFDEASAPFGEWGVDETLDSMAAQHKKMIVVGIDNGAEKRINEYAPYNMEKYGEGEGNAYVDFLAKTLKPFIDQHYRTKKNAANTFVAGSSLGGLISFYAILKYPKIFGAAGVFSPAFWINPQIKKPDPSLAKKIKGRIYFYAGDAESKRMVPDMLEVFNQMLAHSKAQMETVIRAEGQHNEARWQREFPLFCNWLLTH